MVLKSGVRVVGEWVEIKEILKSKVELNEK